MPKDYRIDLENQFQLTKQFPCPKCGNLLDEPEYKCPVDDIVLTFYAKQ